MKIALAFCRAVDAINTWVGETVQWLCLPLVFIVAYEVVARYVFNRPTLWSWDISIQIFAFMTAMAASYTLLQKGHVRSDIITSHLPPRGQLIVNIVATPLFLFGIGALAYYFRQEAWWSVAHREVWESLFAPPLYPLKVMMFVGFCLLFLQGLAGFVRDIISLARPEAGARSE
ncbi:MAG: TRAP transporter small permease subunit [Chloroflexota bacterium]